MKPHEQLLSFIAAGETPTDPIRVMKGLFIFTMAARNNKNLAPEGVFNFGPMDYGPCAPDIYNALDVLERSGQIQKLPVPGETWSKLIATTVGRAAATEIYKSNRDTASFLASLRAWTDKQSFRSLLRTVYEKWPEYAVNSVLPNLRPNR